MKKQKIKNRKGYYGEPIFNIAFNKISSEFRSNKRVSKRANLSMNILLDYLRNIPDDAEKKSAKNEG